MKAEQIVQLEVVEIEHGATVGQISGLLIDANEKKVVALAVSPGGAFAHARYIPFQDIMSIENDVITIPSQETLVERRNFRSDGMIESLSEKRVLTEDGKELGSVHGYDIDILTGAITAISYEMSKHVLGLWKTTEGIYRVPASLVKTLGEHVVVDNSVPDTVGPGRAA